MKVPSFETEKFLDTSLLVADGGSTHNIRLEEFVDKISLILEDIQLRNLEVVDEMKIQRNFDIIIEERENLLKISLQSKINKQKIVLNDLLAGSGYHLIPTQVFGCFRDIGVLGVHLDDLDKPSFLLNLLHEIGHAFQRNTVYENDPDILLSNFWSAYNERNAWAYALVQMRKLEKLGFNVLQSFGEIQHIFQLIDWSLATYDECLIFDILDTYSETQEDIGNIIKALQQRPLFNKKTKNLYQINFETGIT